MPKNRNMFNRRIHLKLGEIGIRKAMASTTLYSVAKYYLRDRSCFIRGASVNMRGAVKNILVLGGGTLNFF